MHKKNPNEPTKTKVPAPPECIECDRTVPQTSDAGLCFDCLEDQTAALVGRLEKAHEERDAARREGGVLHTMSRRELVYMAHPVSPMAGETIGINLARAKTWLRRLAEGFPEVVIIAPWITECELWDDSDPEQRAAGLARCHEVIARCDAFWMVGGRISDGMAGECEVAREHGLTVHDMTRIA